MTDEVAECLVLEIGMAVVLGGERTGVGFIEVVLDEGCVVGFGVDEESAFDEVALDGAFRG